MALVGRPPIVLLDEPTTGLDPLARRALWRALTDAMEQGQSIILTSHSMDEVDALATKMAIMVNGEFKCFGTPQHLKTKFGKGGSITVAATDKVAALEFLTSKFPRGESSDDHSNTFTYSIAEDVPLSELFTVGPPLPSCNVARTPDAVDPWPHVRSVSASKEMPTATTHINPCSSQTMEGAKESEIVEDYSICQTTLEQVFIQFARDQTDSEAREDAYRTR
jgi:ABC-type multidrug transport system ATPase subunit